MPEHLNSNTTKDESGEDKLQEKPVPGFIYGSTIGEMIIRKDGLRTFVVKDGGALSSLQAQHRTDQFCHVPPKDSLAGNVVHFARDYAKFVVTKDLLQQIKTFLHKYLELPETYEDVTALYVLLSWVYEFAPSLPYLRVLGDWGSGKTRFLQVAGGICFRPIFASGAVTPAPIFRILDKYRGTLILDEADFKDSSAWVDMVKILNNGYRPGFPVLRADKENGKWYPRGYQVFGPKLLATRFRFGDEALESRCLTAEMLPLSRPDIPRVLPHSFDDEVHDLRAKLLTFRLSNLLKLKGSEFTNELLEPGLQPRLQEILMPLKALAGTDQYLSTILRSFIKHQQETLYARRRESDEGRVIAAIIQLHEEGMPITAKDISMTINDMDDDADMNARKAGWVTSKLGLKKARVGRVGRRTLIWDEDLIARLAAQNGIAFNPSISQEKSSQTAATTAAASNDTDVSQSEQNNDSKMTVAEI